MSVPPFTFRPLVSGLTGPIREAQAARFRSLTGDKQRRSARGSDDDFRPLGAELPPDDDGLAPVPEDHSPFADDDFDIAADDDGEGSVLGAVDAYGVQDVVGEGIGGDEPSTPSTPNIADDLMVDHPVVTEPAPDASPEEPAKAAVELLENMPPVADAAPLTSETTSPLTSEAAVLHQSEDLPEAAPQPSSDGVLLDVLDRMEVELVERISDEVCSVIAGALRDVAGRKYLDNAIAAFADEIGAMLGQQLGGAVAVTGPRHLIDRLTSELDDGYGNRVQCIVKEDARELSARYDNQSIATRSQEILDAFERAFAE